MSRMQLWCHGLSRFWASCSTLFSFLFIMTLNLTLFYGASYNRRVSITDQLSTEDLSHIDPWVAATLVGLIFITFGMFNLRVLNPGYLDKKEI
jgi:hypothetical protein